ncbi:cytochrome-c oxidase, cbb3-type subunit III [Alsobacter sp. SYSU M60028]|uniref:Cbb3-type cytochrome c oxidase subunit n=1 Tax=Alsobacter ponti TaxID=2962936 RepID=A0ABT1L7T3_9HYPH|nr:cytochrome-c oxidase, cbb3-type subunit III [Alsobacter ponti]MCP8937434.1 cytochrome-c oxidase, cbb3-type subunit III [Alsobacter ponti]
MAVEERDPHSGYLTTGHEWNGIKELNTPVPRPVYVFLLLTALFAVVYWVLMPAWPVGRTYTKGLLGVDQRTAVTSLLRDAAADRAAWTKRIETADFAEIQADPALMQTVRDTGRTLFGDNCAACHGREAQGGRGFPTLTSQSWLWGGDPADIAETIRVGINSSHKDTRTSQMPAFGRDKLLDRQQIEAVIAYVRSLSQATASQGGTAPPIEAGREVFAGNCAPCHGEDAKGIGAGAPDLTDSFWLYGGDADSLYRTLMHGRQGHMPTWEGRLTLADRRILALYLTDMRRSTP